LQFCMLSKVIRQGLSKFMWKNISRRKNMDEEVFTEAQRDLIRYLSYRGMPTTKGMSLVISLWDEQATLEMLKYIAETWEEDPQKLYETALKISRKYNVDESLPD
ncbi:MAG: hypothetical protein IKD18_00355, partial [Clostridia bacterium]|nr:hypothetical protein [Clostridia bacterium]